VLTLLFSEVAHHIGAPHRRHREQGHPCEPSSNHGHSRSGSRDEGGGENTDDPTALRVHPQ
jgi:hypothetical protein